MHLSNMPCCEVQRAAETGLKRICVHIHLVLDSSRSENSQLDSAGGMTSDRSEDFPSRSNAKIYSQIILLL